MTSLSTGNPSPRARRFMAAITVLLTALLLTACGEDKKYRSSADYDPVTQTPEPPADRLDHVHGLDVDPRTGELYAGTHNGLYLVPGGKKKPSHVGKSTFDLMGFTIVAHDRYISSGHPGVKEVMADPVGIMESRDGGKTWKVIALKEAADLHALVASGKTMYGVNSTDGVFFASKDGGKTWDDFKIKSEASIFSLAINPANPKHVAAGADQGILISSNGGRQWRTAKRKVIGLVAWASSDALYMIDNSGKITVSSDSGKTWTSRGNAKLTPSAFIARRGKLYAGAANGLIKRSTDGGRRWKSMAEPPPAPPGAAGAPGAPVPPG